MKKYLILIIILLAPLVTKADLRSGLIGYWPLDSRDNNWTSDTVGTARDRSTSLFNGVFTNMSRATSLVLGKLDQGIRFDATNDYINLGTNVFLTSGSPFTISWWEKVVSDATAYPSRFNLDISGTATYFLVLRGGNGGGAYGPLSFGPSPASNVAFSIPTISTNASSIGIWKHFAITGTDPALGDATTSFSVYENGVSKVINTNLTYGSITNNRIGHDGSDDPTNAVLDDIRIYNRRLSESEVRQLYRNGLTKGWFNLKI